MNVMSFSTEHFPVNFCLFLVFFSFYFRSWVYCHLATFVILFFRCLCNCCFSLAFSFAHAGSIKTPWTVVTSSSVLCCLDGFIFIPLQSCLFANILPPLTTYFIPQQLTLTDRRTEGIIGKWKRKKKEMQNPTVRYSFLSFRFLNW